MTSEKLIQGDCWRGESHLSEMKTVWLMKKFLIGIKFKLQMTNFEEKSQSTDQFPNISTHWLSILFKSLKFLSQRIFPHSNIFLGVILYQNTNKNISIFNSLLHKFRLQTKNIKKWTKTQSLSEKNKLQNGT